MEGHKRSSGRTVAIIFLLVTTLLGLAPIVSVVIAGVLADHFGCHVDEGSVHPCLAFGTDIGQMLYTLGVMGWLMLITIPFLVIDLIGWIVLFLTRSRR